MFLGDFTRDPLRGHYSDADAIDSVWLPDALRWGACSNVDLDAPDALGATPLPSLPRWRAWEPQPGYLCLWFPADWPGGVCPDGVAHSHPYWQLEFADGQLWAFHRPICSPPAPRGCVYLATQTTSERPTAFHLLTPRVQQLLTLLQSWAFTHFRAPPLDRLALNIDSFHLHLSNGLTLPAIQAALHQDAILLPDDPPLEDLLARMLATPDMRPLVSPPPPVRNHQLAATRTHDPRLWE